LETNVRRIAIYSTAVAVFALVVSARAADVPAKNVTMSAVTYEELDKAVTEKKGKVVLLDFWATWCGPCVKKFPHFVETHKKYAPNGLVCVSVSMDPKGKDDRYDKDEVLTFLKEKGATFPNYVALGYSKDDEKFEKRFGLEGGIPFMVMFDKTGKRVWTSEDWAEKDYTAEKFNAELDKLIEAELAK
jgi:thiol-disulfide isomerase/thioredoxin